jgi:hypothetical protein
MMKAFGIWMTLIAIVFVCGCASGGLRSSGKEPPFIGIANLTSAPIRQVSLSKVGDTSREGSFGSVSPVPVGAVQLFERRTDRPRMPSEAQVTWITVYGRTQTRVIVLQEALDLATGAANEALIIELRRDGAVVAVLKTLSINSRLSP